VNLICGILVFLKWDNVRYYNYLNEEKFTWERVAEICGYSEQYCKQDIRNKALESIAIAIFGVEAAS